MKKKKTFLNYDTYSGEPSISSNINMKHASFIFILYSYIFKFIDTTVSKAYPYLSVFIRIKVIKKT